MVDHRENCRGESDSGEQFHLSQEETGGIRSGTQRERKITPDACLQWQGILQSGYCNRVKIVALGEREQTPLP